MAAFDAFLSHAWADDGQGRSTHARVARLAALLAEQGVRCWLDANEMHDDIAADMVAGIDSSSVFVVMATTAYMDKVNSGDPQDNCFKEFNYAMNKRGKINVQVVVLEPDMLDTSQWDDRFLFELGKPLYLDLSRDDNMEARACELAAAIRRNATQPPLSKRAKRRMSIRAALRKGDSATPLEASENGLDAVAAAVPQREIEAEAGKAFFEVGFDPLAAPRYKAKDFVAGTRQWVFAEADRWYRDADWARREKSVFVLLGVAGTGKSVFAAEYCRRGHALGTSSGRSKAVRRKSKRFFRLSLRRGSRKSVADDTFTRVIAVHFFNHDDKHANSPRLAVLSIANQFVDHLPGYMKAIGSLHRSEVVKESLHGLFMRLIAEPLSRLPSPGHRVVLVLDALDECSQNDRRELLDVLQQTWKENTPEWLGLLVTGRPEGLLPTKLREFGPILLETDSEQNLADLRIYLRGKIEPHLANAQDADRAVQIMLDRSEGLFLYARFVENVLEENPGKLSLADIESSGRFPHGLAGFYARYFRRLLEDAFDGDEELYHATLSPLVAARAPIPEDLLRALLGQSKKKFRQLMNRAQQLLVVSDGTIRFIHKTMTEWLLVEGENSDVDLSVDAEAGHEALGKLCMCERKSPFAYHHALYHLRLSNPSAAPALLLNLKWLLTAFHKGVNPAQLVVDWEALVSDREESGEEGLEDADWKNAQTLMRAVENSTYALMHDPAQLPSQLLGRVPQSHPIIAQIPSKSAHRSAWLRPVSASLEPADSALRKTFFGHENAVFSLQLAQGGSKLVSASQDQTARVWDVSTGTVLRTLRWKHSYVHGAVLLDDGRIVTGSNDNALTLFDDGTDDVGTLVIRKRRDAIRALLVDAAQELVFTGWEDSSVHVHRIEPRGLHETAVLPHKHGRVTALAYAQGVLVTGVTDKTHSPVRVWGISEKCQLLHKFDDHRAGVRAVALAPKLQLFASGCSMGHIRVRGIDMKHPGAGCTLRTLLSDYHAAVDCLTFDEDRQWLLSGGASNSIIIHACQDWSVVCTLKGHTSQVSALALDPQRQILISGSFDRMIKVWDVSDAGIESARSANSQEGHDAAVFRVHNQGDLVVSTSVLRTICLWSKADGQLVDMVQAHSDLILADCASQEAGCIATGGSDAKVAVHDFSSGKLSRRFILSGHHDWVEAVVVQGTERVVSGSRDHTIIVWSLDSGEMLQRLAGHTSYIRSLVVVGSQLVSASKDATLRIWDLATGASKHVLAVHQAAVSVVWVLPGGEEVISRSDDGTARRWNVSSGELLETRANSDRAYFDVPQSGVLSELTITSRRGLSLDWIDPRRVGWTCDSAITSVDASESEVVVGTAAGRVHILSLVTRA